MEPLKLKDIVEFKPGEFDVFSCLTNGRTNKGIVINVKDDSCMCDCIENVYSAVSRYGTSFLKMNTLKKVNLTLEDFPNYQLSPGIMDEEEAN